MNVSRWQLATSSRIKTATCCPLGDAGGVADGLSKAQWAFRRLWMEYEVVLYRRDLGSVFMTVDDAFSMSRFLIQSDWSCVPTCLGNPLLLSIAQNPCCLSGVVFWLSCASIFGSRCPRPLLLCYPSLMSYGPPVGNVITLGSAAPALFPEVELQSQELHERNVEETADSTSSMTLHTCCRTNPPESGQ